MNDFLMDLRFASRNFGRSPGFVAVAVVTLALGIAANAIVFGMINSLVFKPLPYGDFDELMILWGTFPEEGVTINSVSAPDYTDWRARAEVFEDIAAQQSWQTNLTGIDRPERLQGYRVTGNLFDVLEVEPMLGRTFVPEEDEPGGDKVVVLDHRVWNLRFGADASLVGREIILDGEPYTVIGVMPPKFAYPQFQFAGDLWVPIQLTPEQRTEPRGRRYLAVIGRLREGAAKAQAQAEMDRIAAQIGDEYPETNSGRGVSVIGIQEQLSQPLRPALIILPIMGTLVLLICCANVANLFLARGSARSGEVAIRMALGAGRIRVVRQLLTESLLIAVVGGAAGYLLASAAGALISATMPAFMREVAPSAFDESTDYRVMFFTFAISLVAGIIFGLAPALRTSRPGLQEALKGGAASVTAGFAGNRLRNIFVVSELSLAVVLVVGAGLMLKAFFALVSLDLGFDPDNVLTLNVALPEAKYSESEGIVAFFEDVEERVGALAGVEVMGTVNMLPLTFRNNTGSYQIEGHPEPEPGRRPRAGYRPVTPGYFRAMGMPLLRGRSFADRDNADGREVAIVNDELVQRHWPAGDDPVGARLSFDRGNSWIEIVGVVSTVRHDALTYEAQAEVYLPFAQAPRRSMTLAIRTGVPPLSLAEQVQQEIWTIDADQPIDELQTLNEIVSTSLFIFRMPAYMMMVLAASALVLAAVGLYGVMSYVVVQRTHEVGIRVALGAGWRDVIRLIARRALLLSIIGIALGLVGALAMARLISSVAEGIDATDPLIFAGVPVLLATIVILASYLPARRAARVDPVIALRTE